MKFNCMTQTVCYFDGPMDNSGVRVPKEPMVAFYFLLVIVLMHINTRSEESIDETCNWHYPQVKL